MAAFDPSDMQCAVCTSLDDLVSAFAASEAAGGGGRVNFVACGSHAPETVAKRMLELNGHAAMKGWAPELAKIVKVPIKANRQKRKKAARLNGPKAKLTDILAFTAAHEEIEVAKKALQNAQKLVTAASEEYLRSSVFTKSLRAIKTVTREIEDLAKEGEQSENHSEARCVHSAEIPWRVNVSDWAKAILKTEPLDDQMEEIRKHVAAL